MGDSRERTEIVWHSGFYGAMELELISNKGILEFQRECPLSKEPLRMDLLIIRKNSHIPIENEIGRIFKEYNILEYKSPNDSLSIDDYYKTVGYACLYKGLGERVNRIPAKELTVSIFRDRYPRKLFQALTEEGETIEELYPGIYKIRGSLPFATQVVVTKRLKEEKHRSLRLLSPKAKEQDIKAFIQEALELREPGDRNNVEAVLQVSIAANKELYEKIRRESGMCDALRDLMKEEIAEEKRKSRLEGRQEGRQEGQQEGQQALLEAIRNLMTNMKLSADQAMAAMSIPMEDRGFYQAKL